ncbi:hypothetical protein [Streptomyces sp. NPDC090021]
MAARVRAGLLVVEPVVPPPDFRPADADGRAHPPTKITKGAE